jgi:endonuclease YncB( thermonuclease family)
MPEDTAPLGAAASADILTGKVVKITDGDTLYVLDANYQQHKIRLAGIDAPERKQAYGLASRKHLASIVAGKQVGDCGCDMEPYTKLV